MDSSRNLDKIICQSSELFLNNTEFLAGSVNTNHSSDLKHWLKHNDFQQLEPIPKNQRIEIYVHYSEMLVQNFYGQTLWFPPFLRKGNNFGTIFLSRLPQAWRYIGIQFSIRLSICPSINIWDH